MKFSFSLIKKLIPGARTKKEVVKELNLHSFETDDLRGDVLDASIPPNRFSDVASHWGMAKEISAIYGKNLLIKNLEFRIKNSNSVKAPFKVLVQDKTLCPRYAGQYFDNIKISPSPKWLQKILIDCGLRPINNVVDIMNYAMLEIGQPLHAFDYDKLATSDPAAEQVRYGAGKRQVTIIVRRAKKKEKITTLDDKTYELNENVLVIADSKGPLAIGGIKGGKKAEVGKNTKKIIVEAANFNGANIYKSSKLLKLSTDASLRFSHNISPELVLLGLNRAAQLLKEITKANPGRLVDINFTKPRRKIIKFDLERFNKFIGINLDIQTVQKYLQNLGFTIIQDKIHSFLVEAPALRSDIETFEDLAEEVIRLYGYNRLKSSPPHIHLTPSGFEDQIILKDKIRKILIGAGLSEVSNYSFIGENDLFLSWKDEVFELENPISNQYNYLRPSLAPHLIKNINNNFRFFDEVRIFEIGKIFFKNKRREFNEKIFLGLALASKNKKESIFELKGVIKELFGKIGLVDYLMPELGKKDFSNNYLRQGEILKIEAGGLIIGYLGRINKELIKGDGALAEIDLNELLKQVVEEHEYRPLAKYPSVMRDISMLVDRSVRVGEIMQAIQEVDLKYIEDVDLIDEYDFEQQRSLTFRIIFQAENRTLTDEEVNKEMNKITKVLQSRFKAKIR